MQGKGDGNRTTNYGAYRQRFDLIDWNKADKSVYDKPKQEEDSNRDLDTAAR